MVTFQIQAVAVNGLAMGRVLNLKMETSRINCIQ
jgi:hypothetical protein